MTSNVYVDMTSNVYVDMTTGGYVNMTSNVQDGPRKKEHHSFELIFSPITHNFHNNRVIISEDINRERATCKKRNEQFAIL